MLNSLLDLYKYKDPSVGLKRPYIIENNHLESGITLLYRLFKRQGSPDLNTTIAYSLNPLIKYIWQFI